MGSERSPAVVAGSVVVVVVGVGAAVAVVDVGVATGAAGGGVSTDGTGEAADAVGWVWGEIATGRIVIWAAAPTAAVTRT